MRAAATTAILATLLFASTSEAGRNFTLRDDISGNGFFDAFTWWDSADPTHGFVDYVSKSDAQKAQLSYVDSTTGRFVMRADDSTVLSAGSSTGRKSVRIHSKKLMGDGVLIAKVSKMPVGCATWPALWTSTRGTWPTGGEIDIVEGANDQGPTNLASLHTSDGCSIAGGSGYANLTTVDAATRNTTTLTSSAVRLDSGTTESTYCGYQPGCSVRFSGQKSFGSEFNDKCVHLIAKVWRNKIANLFLFNSNGGFFVMTRDTIAGGSGVSLFWLPLPGSEPKLTTRFSFSLQRSPSTSGPRTLLLPLF